MAEPFVFHYRRGEAGNPEQMYLADIRAECSLCGQPQVQRYYHSTPMHPVTVATLQRLAESVASKTAYECPNCGTDVGPEAALSTALTWAFADDRGVVRGIVEAPEAEVRWQFEPGRRLDPQALPGWTTDPARPTFEALSERAILEAFGRSLSVKSVVRTGLATSDSVAVSEDMSWFRGTNDRAGTFDRTAAISLEGSVPADLATHRNPSGIPGAYGYWWPDDIDPVDVVVHVDLAVVDAAIERAFDVANLSWRSTDAGFEAIQTPREQQYPRALPRLAVAQRAVYTGITPGDAARLTAEEIVGTLLNVW